MKKSVLFCFLFFSFSYLKDTAFTAVKRGGAFKSTYVQVVSFVNGRYTKRVPFLSKMAYKRVKGWISGRSPLSPPPPPPCKTLLSTRGRAKKDGRDVSLRTRFFWFSVTYACEVTSSYGRPTDTTRYSLSVFPTESPRPPDPEGLHCCIKERL